MKDPTFIRYKPEEKIPYLGPAPKSLDISKILRSIRIKKIPVEQVHSLVIKHFTVFSN